ncbi:uncharacterized protein SPPG_08822 [Spizellomyces punctatus DAOM BR117]|uniref:Anoctamin transmembrane domain-containing protein n=1 Tax=Spizellomyces punctatus (strain DAOM BR117) TaxID=645134 RepID=A0A0L0HTP0_SPIPD|nr:uncharacterized protein SPPG_08822 [Spizellomyces punctatus DAOM BR117]KND04462.1 hypothetical protein SPPG_08822 [Spizellomyces punctatus DAOM BR117]|eukprot:XP_016612501.1 hypothetical protein SPPG_08822 [Spizellomyces punctatus DAOM BR117]
MIATLYLEFWKRRNVRLAWWWDVLHFEKDERTRPQWYGTTVKRNPVTHRNEAHFPASLRRLILCGTITVMLSAMLIVVATIAGFIVVNVYLRWYFDTYLPDYDQYAGALSALVSLVVMTALRPCLVRLSKFLTDLENHKTETMYQDSLTAKNLLFDFLNTFGSLFYIALMKIWIQDGKLNIMGHTEWHDQCLYENCMLDLTIQMAVVFMGQGFLEQLRNFILPFWTESWRKSRKAPLNAESTDMEMNTAVSSQYEEDAKLLPFGMSDGFTDGYNGTVIQFGFIVLFAVAFPLAPLLSIIHNALRMRIDAYNLLTKFRRPYAFQAEDIGMWHNWLEAVSYLAVLVNALTIAFASPYFEANYLNLLGESTERQWTLRIAFILIFEHVVFGIKALVAWWIPDIPYDVKHAIQREEYINKGELDEADADADDVDPDTLRQNMCRIM